MSTAVVTNTLVNVSDQPLTNVYIEVQLRAPETIQYSESSGYNLVSRVVTRTNNLGVWSLNLVPNAQIQPAGTIYEVHQHIPGEDLVPFHISVPNAAGPFEVMDILTQAGDPQLTAGSQLAFEPRDSGMVSTNVEDAILEAYTHGGGSGLQSTTTHLTGAQLATLQSAQPFTLVAAPGAGKVLVPQYALLEFVYANSIYSNPGFLEVKWPNATQSPTSQTFGLRFSDRGWSMTFVSTLNHATPNLDGPRTPGLPFHRAWAENQPLVLTTDAVSDPDRQGIITASGVTAGGNNYAVGDTGNIPTTDALGDAANPATYVVTTVSSGHVTGFTLTNHDGGYTVGPGLPTETSGGQPGTGTGFTVNATAINTADGDLYVTVFYSEYTVH